MFYEEKLIDGVIHYRVNPNGTWTPLTLEDLSSRLLAADKSCHEIHQNLRKVLKILLDDAEKRDFDPPVPTEAVAFIETMIAETKFVINQSNSRGLDMVEVDKCKTINRFKDMALPFVQEVKIKCVPSDLITNNMFSDSGNRLSQDEMLRILLNLQYG